MYIQGMLLGTEVELSNNEVARRGKLPPALRRGNEAVLPVFVLTIALLLTAAAATYVFVTTRARERLRFVSEAQQTQDIIRARFDTYTSLLRGASGLFAASDHVSRSDFHQYVSLLDLPHHYPGVRGLNYSVRVAPEEASRLVAEQRSGGEAKFHLWPPTSSPNKDRQAILYLEPPETRNPSAFGLDMTSEPTRRAAMEQARDTGGTVATGKIIPLTSLGTKNQPGFILFLPVYKGGAVPATVEARRQALVGYVLCPFRSQDFLTSVMKERPDTMRHLDLRVYDGQTKNASHLLYQSNSAHSPSLSNLSAPLSLTAEIPVAGRPWTLIFTSTSGFQNDGSDLTYWTIAAGLVITILFFRITRALVRSRDRAEDNAARLRLSEDTLRENDLRQRAFFRDVLASVTEGRLRLCDSPADLPTKLPSANPPIMLTSPTLKHLRRAVANAAATVSLPEERAHDLITAVGEASMNAVVHAGGGTGSVAVGNGGVVQVWVKDQGSGIDVGRLPRATLERGYTTAGSLGHGFFLMLHFVDRIWLLTGPEGTTLVLEQQVTPPEPGWLTHASGDVERSGEKNPFTTAFIN